jgi:hypothetical protein
MMSMQSLMRSISPTAARSIVGTSWIAALGQAGAPETLDQGRMNFARGMEALGAAAQDRRAAGLEADTAGIRGHVRPGLVDDADDAERHAHALDREAIWPRPFPQHGTDGIAEGGDLLQPLGRGLDPLLVELQPVEQCAGQVLLLGRRHVARIGRQDRVAHFPHRRRRRHQRLALRLSGCQRELGCRRARGPAHG